VFRTCWLKLLCYRSEDFTSGFPRNSYGSRYQEFHHYQLPPGCRRMYYLRRRSIYSPEACRSFGVLVSPTSLPLTLIINNGNSFRQLIVRNSKDPTFVFLALLWSTFYAWDQALEALYAHFSLLVRKSSPTIDSLDLHLISYFPLWAAGIPRNQHQRCGTHI
jgi:hypothetical protein